MESKHLESLNIKLSVLETEYSAKNKLHRVLSNEFITIQQQLDGVNESLKVLNKNINAVSARITIETQINNIDNNLFADDITNTCIKLAERSYIKICGFKSESFKSSIIVEKLSSDFDFKNVIIRKDFANIQTVVDFYKNGKIISIEEYNDVKLQLLNYFV